MHQVTDSAGCVAGMPVFGPEPLMSHSIGSCLAQDQDKAGEGWRVGAQRGWLRDYSRRNRTTRATIGLLLVACCGCSEADSRPTSDPQGQPVSVPCLYPVRANNAYGYIDSSGEMRIQPRYQRADAFFEGLARVRIEGRYGFIDQTGRMVIEPQLAYVMPRFREGYVSFQDVRRGKWGFIDRTGRVTVAPEFEIPSRFQEGLASVRIGGKYGFVNTDGKMVIAARFDDVGEFSGGLALAGTRVHDLEEDGKVTYGYIDKNGSFAIEPVFDEASDFSEGQAFVLRGGRLDCIDRSGLTLFRVPADNAGLYFEGLARIGVLQNGSQLMGFIDKSGRIVIEPRFQLALAFSEGLAAVCTDTGWGFIDKTGAWAISPVFSSVCLFTGGLAWVEIGDRRGYVKHDGEWVWSSSELQEVSGDQDARKDGQQPFSGPG